MNYDLSVIIPIYNGEKYIKKCINSILNNESNIEIIIINDGSKDNTKNELDKIKKENIKIIDLKWRQGISHARNIGIKNIKGKYFTFVDADDFVEPNTYDIILKYANENNLEICGYNYYETSKEKIKSKYNYENIILNNKELVKKILKDEISMVVWDKIYKTSKYKKIRFKEKLQINEDYEFILKCIIDTKKSMFINEYLYNYYKHEKSITSQYTCDIIKENNYINYVDKTILKLLKNYKEFDYYISNNNLKNIHLYSKCIDKQNRYKYMKKNINKNQLKKLLNYKINKNTKIEIIIYLISIRLHILLFPLYKKIRKLVRKTK